MHSKQSQNVAHVVEKARRCISLLLLSLLPALFPAGATTYDVGSDKPFQRLSDVPWGGLLPGDTVNIHCKPGGYHEIVQISQAGTSNSLITIRGIPDPQTGRLPVIDGSSAVMDANVDFRNPVFENVGVILVTARRTGFVYGTTAPSWISIENLEVRNGRYSASNTFTDQHGVTRTYDLFGCGIYIEYAHHLAIRNCEISFNGNGIFANSNDQGGRTSQDLLIEGNYIHDNGNSGRWSEHDTYIEADRVTYQYNR